MTAAAPATETIDIRKYPNRRYYDATHSTHVTLEQIHQLIADGHEVIVTDSKTGEDITVRVLAQIMIEYDAAKLGAFTSELMHAMIRSNEKLVDEFVNTHFSRAFESFAESRQAYNAFLRRTMGLPDEPASGDASPAWGMDQAIPFWRAMFGMADDASATEGRPDADHAATGTAGPAPDPDVSTGSRQAVLKHIRAIREQLAAIEAAIVADQATS